MALQNLFSWDHITTPDIISLPRVVFAGSQATIAATGGRDNGPCLTCGAQTDNADVDIAIDPHPDVTIGTWIAFNGTPGNDSRGIIAFCNPSATEITGEKDYVVTIVALSDGSLRAYQGQIGGFTAGSGTIFLTTPPGVVTFGGGSSQYVEVRIVIGATGSITIRVNEAVVGQVNNVNTIHSAANTITFVKLTNATLNSPIRYDDTYVVTGNTVGDGWDGFMGILKIHGKIANAIGDRNEWTPSVPSGINWQNVDEPTPNPTDFNDATTVGLVDLYHIEDVAFDPIAVEVDLYMRKLDAGASSVDHVVRIGGVDYVAAAPQTLSAGYKYYKRVYTRSPAGTSWSQSIYNAMQAGPRKAV